MQGWLLHYSQRTECSELLQIPPCCQYSLIYAFLHIEKEHTLDSSVKCFRSLDLLSQVQQFSAPYHSMSRLHSAEAINLYAIACSIAYVILLSQGITITAST